MFTREDGTTEKISREMWPAAFPTSVKTAVNQRLLVLVRHQGWSPASHFPLPNRDDWSCRCHSCL